MRKDMKQIFRNVTIVLLLLLFGIKLSWAEDVELEKIVVTATRTEESQGETVRKVDVITAKALESSSARDLSEALTKLTSVTISNYGGLGAQKNIGMRGSTTAQVLVMIDGRPINSQRDGKANLSSIPLDNISRVEVIHGPASNLYGSYAMGGTVNIITKSPPKEGQKTELTTSFGTFHTYLEKLLHGARMGKFGYLVTEGYESSEGFRDNSKFNAKDSNVKLEYEVNDSNNLILNSGFYRSRVGTPGTISSPDIDDKQIKLQNYFDFNWNLKPDNLTRITTKIYQNYDRLEFIENTPTFTKDIHTTKVRGLDLQYAKGFSDVYQLICGFNYVINLNDSTTSAKHKYTVLAGYVENQLDLFRNFTINFGARVDEYSNFGTEFNPSAGFVYKFNNDFKLHGLISRSFRAPTFNDLYWPDDGTSRGNPNLKPEKGITEELGIRKRLCKYLETDITYFRSDFNDLIKWEQDSGRTQPKNINSAVMNGVELENNISITDNLNIGLNYTYLKAKDKKTHKYLTYQPKHKLDCSLGYKDLNGFIFEFKGQFTDKRFDNSTNTVKVKRFFVLGLDISKKFKHGLTYFMSIDNLLNKKYQVIRNYPLPGFSLTSGMKLEF